MEDCRIDFFFRKRDNCRQRNTTESCDTFVMCKYSCVLKQCSPSDNLSTKTWVLRQEQQIKRVPLNDSHFR